MRWEEHEKIAILESKILWVLKCLQNYKVCMEKNCCSFKFIDICPEILLLSCLAISRPFPPSPLPLLLQTPGSRQNLEAGAGF